MNQKVYFIYKYTFPNGKVYIGQTFEGSNRFGNPVEYHKQPVHKAMLKYPEYKKEILEYCSAENVDEREQYYIALYHSMEKQFGYNLTSGGNKNKQWAPEVREKIIQKLKNPSEETRRKFSARSSGQNNPMYGTHRSGKDNPHAIPIIQYDLNGAFIAKYDCAKTACDLLGLNSVYSNVCSCAKGEMKSAANFIWRYEGSSIPVVPYVRKTTKGFKHSDESKNKMRQYRLGKVGGPRAKPVLQYDLNGNYINEYPSANNADVVLGLCNGGVLSACNGERKSVGGFMWRFKEGEIRKKIKPYKKDSIKPVLQCDKEGNPIRKWNSAKEAGEALKINASGITGCCKGYPKYNTAGGYKWKYAVEE